MFFMNNLCLNCVEVNEINKEFHNNQKLNTDERAIAMSMS